MGVALRDADAHAGQRSYANSGDVTTIDVASLVADRGDGVSHIRRLLAATAGRAPMHGCFGMHEWAMVYRASHAERDHTQTWYRSTLAV